MYLLPHQVSLFQGIKDPELIGLIDDLSFRRVPQGFPIFQQGESGTEIYAILNGEIEIVGRDPHGDFVSVAKLGAGSIFGEFSYFTGQPRAFAAITARECAIIEISAHWLNSMAKRFPVMADQLGALFRGRILTNVLRSTKLFAPLSPAELEELTTFLELRTYPDGAEILREGEKGNDLYAIKQGHVSVTKRKQGKKISLKDLGPGEVLGEMAAITGAPRSASAHAVGSAEILVLSGDRFKMLLQSHPKILSTMEDIVRHRSEQTRQALEAVVSEVFEGEWQELEGAQGLRVDSLKMYCRIETPESEVKAHVKELSPRKWAVAPSEGMERLRTEMETKVQILSGSTKFLQEVSKRDPLPARVQSVADGEAILQFGPEASAPLLGVLKLAAQAKLRGLIFPRYDVKETPIDATVRVGEGPEIRGSLRSMSVTHAAVRLDGPCPIGQLLTLRLTRGEEILSTTTAIALGAEEAETEFQLEYETSVERAALENVVRILSGGIGQARMGSPEEDKPEPVPRAAKAVLVKKFESAKEFIRTYMSSIDAGVLRVAAVQGVSVGMQVQVQLLIPGFPGVRKAVCSGRVKSQAKGTALVELIDPGQELQNRLRALFEKLMAEHAEESWENRKQELTATLRKSLWEDPTFRRIAFTGLVAANVALYLLTYLKYARPQIR